MRRLALVALLVAACSGCTHDKAAAAKDKTEPSPADMNEAALRAECCAQCGAAAKRDPAGMDIGTKDCATYAGEFNGQPGVDVKCVAHFGQRPATVGDCRKEHPELK